MKSLTIILSAIIVSQGIDLSNGIYSYDSKIAGTANRYNKFTGEIYLCINSKGCTPYEQTKEANTKTENIDCSKIESELDRFLSDCE